MKTILQSLVLYLLCATSACGAAPLLTRVELRPQAITPNRDHVDDVAELTYSLSANSTVSITVTGADGKVHILRSDQPRSPGDYQLLIGGVINGQVLPNGVYGVQVEARSAGAGAVAVANKMLTVKDTIIALPEIQNLTVFPDRFTPNRDGIGDRVTISYNLSREADVLVYLLGGDGRKFPVAERLDGIVKPGEPGVHTYDYEGGVDLGAMPPPDGTYQVIVEAVDPEGNRIIKTAPLTIIGGGVPRAEIIGATAVLAPTSVPLGGTLTFTATVGNVGTVPIRTKGPWSGTSYSSQENFNTIGMIEEPGVFRIGVDYEGNSQGRLYTFRWGLGTERELPNMDGHRYLMPNQRTVVVGHIRIVNKMPIASPYFWVGMIHEQVRIVNDRIAPTRITIGF